MITRNRTSTATVVLAAILLAPAAQARGVPLKVQIGGLGADGRFPDRMAFCPPAGSQAKDISPAVNWTRGPKGTRSYVLLMSDPDVPADFSQINKAGMMIAAAATRIKVYHWVLDDIPARTTALAEGADSAGLVPHGKSVGRTDHGRRGANVYTSFLASNSDMAGVYGGYDGPCPPANDQRVHRYVVQIFALDTPSLGLSGAFDGAALEKAMRDHILAQGKAIARYSLRADQ